MTRRALLALVSCVAVVVGLVTWSLGALVLVTGAGLLGTVADRLGRSPDPQITVSDDAPYADLPAADEILFPVEDATLQPSRDGIEPDAVVTEVWDLYVEIAGDDAAAMNGFAVFDDEDDTLQASVWRDTKTGSTWTLDVNLAYADERDALEATLIHEYGHVLSLSLDQVSEVSGSCPTLEMDEGCAHDDSWIASFVDRFWGPESTWPDGSDESTEDWFQDNGGYDAFVSRYAATSGLEDFAESWAAYVTADDPGHAPRDDDGRSVRGQKVLFFEDYPALVAERDRIRSALGY